MNPKRRKLSGQLYAVPVENDPVPAAGNRTGDIDGGIIDENTLPGHEAEFVRKRLINLAHGLDKTDIAGNQFSVKEGAGRDFRPVDMLCLAGIAEQPDSVAGVLQPPDQVLHPGDRIPGV